MLQVLNATTKSLEVVLSGAVTTRQLSFTAAWSDDNGTTFVEGSTDGATNDTTPVTLVAAPAASTRRIVKSLTIANIDTASATITVSYNDNSTLRTIAVVTLAVGDTWTMEGTFDNTGKMKVTTSSVNSPGGSNTQLQFNSSGSFGGVTGATTNGTVVTLTSALATTAFSPSSNDGAALGTTAAQFSDLFLAEGGVINWDNGDATMTQTNNDITIAGITTFGVGTSTAVTLGTIELGAASDTTIARVSAGVVSIEGITIATSSNTLTLTNKTITAGIFGGAGSVADAGTFNYILPTVDGTASGEVTNAFNSGYSSTAVGDLVYLDSSGTWQKADADASATTYGSGPLGIALAVVASGNPVSVLLKGFIYAATPFPTFTIGGAIYMSSTAGAVTQTAPSATDSATRVLGYAVHADKMYFNPSSDYITHV